VVNATTNAGTRVGLVLPTSAAAQFVMLLDSSVMNVAIATVAKDVGTTVTGIQTAITMYTLVMAMFMVTGGKLGSMFGRKRIFMIGCIVYGLGSLTTAVAPNLPILILGWSFLEGVGAAMILPAVVALVAANVPAEGRPRAFGLVMAAGGIAVAVGPLIGGVATTYFSWRWVFVGEVVIVVLILFLARRMEEPARPERVPLDVIGATLLSIGLGIAVYGLLRSSEWGWVIPRPGGPSVLGVSPTIWLIVLGGLTVWVFFEWEAHVIAQGREPLVRPSIFRYREMNAGLTMFFVQYLVQAGVFFTIPLFLSVALGLTALETGVRILPLSIALLAGALGIPRFFPQAPPRLVVRLGVLAMLAGTLVLILALDPHAEAAIVTVPLLLIGLGIGALASQLGAITVSAVPDRLSGEVGGLQNTATNLGAAIGTALAGSILIAALTASFLTSVTENPDIPASVKDQANVQLAAGIPFMSDADLQAELDQAGVSPDVAAEAIEANDQARVDGLRSALSVLALVALSGLFFARAIPKTPKMSSEGTPAVGA
jgi:EmrB/QacA subfamily drug resistance transporter